MGRSKQRKRHSQLGGAKESSVIKCAGRYYVTSTSNALSTFFVQFSPLVMDARLLQLSDSWQEFRFTKAKVAAWLGNLTPASPSVTPGGANLALGYTPALPSSQPALISEVLQLQNAAIGNGTFGSGYPKIRLSRNDMTGASPVKWYRRGTAYDDTLEVQGAVYISSSDLFSARPLSLFIEYEIEFRTPADPATTATRRDPPDPASMYAQIEELQRVLGITRVLVKRPPPLTICDSGDETKDDGYVRVNEPSENADPHQNRAGQPASRTPVLIPQTPGSRASAQPTPGSARRF